MLQDAAAVTARNAVFGGAEIRAYNNASFYAISSQIQHMIAGAADHWPYEATDYATFELVDSSVGILCLYFDAWSGGTVQGLRPGLYSDWDLQRDNEIEWLPYNVILRNIIVEGVWEMACTGSSTLTLIDSQLHHFGIWDEAVATLQDCVIEQGVLLFTDPPIPVVSFEGLQPGHFDEWRLRDPGQEEPYRFNLFIHNSDVNNWYLRTASTDLSVSNSTIGVLRVAGDTQATVDNSTVGDFWVWWYDGTITFTSSIMQNWYETRWTDFWMKGTVTIEGGTIIQDANGPWTDAIIHREYPVLVTLDGTPAPNASLSLETQSGSTIWTGTTDLDGTAIFTLTFTETNYLDTWTLSAYGSGFYTDTALVITSSTPIALSSIFGDSDGDCEVTVADIMEVANRWRCRSGDDCYDERYDIDKDGDIDIVDIIKVAAHWGETCE